MLKRNILLLVVFFITGIMTVFAQSVSDTQELERLISQLESIRENARNVVDIQELEKLISQFGSVREGARNDIEWRRQWIACLEETERFFDTFYKTQSVPYSLFYSTDIKQGAINYQNETIALSFETNLRANETWLLPVHRVVQVIYNSLLATEKRRDWGLDRWPWTSVTLLNPFGGRRNNNFTIIAELVNDHSKVIGRQTFQANCSWGWSNNNGRPDIQANNNIKNNVTFSVKVDDITDNLTIRIASINGVDAATAVRNGVLQIVAMTGEEYNADNSWEFSFNAIHGLNRGAELTNLTIPEIVWGEQVTSIGQYAYNYLGLEAAGYSQRVSLIIPDSVTYINEAFTDYVTDITIGANVSIARGAFGSSNFGRFPQFYEENGRRSGIYTRTGNSVLNYAWTYRPR